MMVARAKTDIKKKHYPLFIRFAEYYVKLTWINGRYECIEWNEYRRQIATNDFSESYNNLVQIECGLHSPFFLFVWHLKRFSAKHIARWNRFKAKGFERASSMKEHLKLLNVKDLWDKIGRREISLYEYMDYMIG
ncbi:MAG: hypothetical protein GY938_03900, partial [Ketobacter sp.]|nr:hypothetical protein [Ketobacter sp.]